MKRRIFAFLMAMIMLVSAFPAQVLATESAEPEMYFIDDTIWVPAFETPTAEVVETGKWVMTEETKTEIKLVCSETEHTHHYNCEADAEGNYSCGLAEHAHLTDGCASDCALAEHTHRYNCEVDAEGNYICGGDESHVHVTDGCASDCAIAEHTHRYNCEADAEGNYSCGLTAHTHVTGGCASDCALAEHTHGDACSQQTTLVKWVVELKEDEMSTFGRNGSNLGWEYSKITANRSGGFDLRDPSGAEHLGQYVTVTINGENSVEGTSGMKSRVLSSTSTGVVNIKTALGYYIDQIVLACYMPSYDSFTRPIKAPFNCQTAAGDNAYEYVLGDSTPTNVTISLSDLYKRANHDSNVNDYFLMIQIAPLPAPVYVGYDSGSAGGHDIAARPVSETGNIEYVSGSESNTATPVGSYATWSYPTAAATHNTFSISPEAEAEANAHGYSFAGWQLEYYTQYAENGNVFSGEMTVGGTNLFKGTPVTLTVHAKLTAIWQPMDHIKVSKVWNDSNNQDGIRPDSVEIHLLRNGVHNGAPLTLSAANNWSGEWTVPSKDENGNTIRWTVEEVIPTGYTYDVTGDAENGFVVTNTHTPEKINLEVQKVWNDDNNRDGVRPHGVKVQLYCNGEAMGEAVTLTETGSWVHEWQDLVKYKAGGTAEVNVYTVKEVGYVDADGKAVENPGYTATTGKDEHTGVLLITNSRASTTMNIPVQKVWSDNDNQDGKRTASVTVTLNANGVSTGKTLTLNAENQWKGVFENVYVKEAGTSIVYSVVENEVPDGYTAEVTGNAANGFVVTNTHIPEKTDVPVTKIWADENDQDGKRPKSITVQLYADGVAVEGKTLTLDAAGNWQGTFTGLTKYKAGQEIKYTAKETAVPEGYDVSYNGTTITNTHTPMTATLNVEKVWNDNNNQDGKRPEKVQVTLYANGKPLAKDSDGKPVFEPVEGQTYGQFTLVLKKSENWIGKWENMPRFHNGQRISYTTVESGYAMKETDEITLGVSKIYSVEHKYEGTTTENGKATITNTYAPEKTSINVQKVWDDDNRDNKRPESVTVTLYADGVSTGQSKVLSKDNEWDCDFVDLPKYKAGQEIVYTVVENAVEGYTTTYSQYTKDDGTTTMIDENGVITVTNTRATEKISVTVTKAWNDANNQDGKRPQEVTVSLRANGYDLTATGTTVTLNADNNWTHTWTGLYKNYHGSAITYSVVEDPVTDYTAEYTTSKNGDNFVIEVKNTHEVEKVSVPVSKVWSDANDQDGIRPEAVEVTLFAGNDAKETVILHAGNNWRHTFTNLEKHQAKTAENASANVADVVYTVQETGHYDKYDPNAQSNVRTDGAPEDYAVNVEGNVITNTHEPEKTTMKVTKVWEDSEDKDKKRPASITVHLLKNGDHTQKHVELSAANNWTYTWEDLAKFEEGKEINYTVYEQRVKQDGSNEYEQWVEDGYISSNTRVDNNVTITNTRTTDKTVFTVQKVWNDTNNQDNVRYDGVMVQLYADGVEEGNPVELNAVGHWRHTWENLEKNTVADGQSKAVAYTVKELHYIDYVTENGTATKKEIELSETEYVEPENNMGVLDSFTGFAIITNTHQVEKTSVTVTKVWNDENNQDGIRPDSVTVELYQNGSPTGKTAVLKADADENSNWKYTFTDLDVHHGIGVDNVYTVVEVVPNGEEGGKQLYKPGTPNGYTEVTTGNAATGYTVTNSHTPEKTSVTVTKEWADANDQDGIRPKGIEVQLYADDVAVDGKTLTLDATTNWQGTFTGLDKFKAGQEIKYTAKETAVPEGYTATESGTTITNTHAIETVNLNVEKVWNDANNQDGKRPVAVEITLYVNGQPTDNKLTLRANDDPDLNWKGAWKNMPRYHNGQRISYTTVETGSYVLDENGDEKFVSGKAEVYTVTHSYQSIDVNGVKESLTTVTNTYAPEETSINVQKVWDDEDNRDNKRPAEVKVKLMRSVEKDASGKNVWEDVAGKIATLSPANEWDCDFTGLPKYHNGVEILYNVVETTNDPNYPSVSYDYDQKLGVVTITNKREVDRVNVSVNKQWDDANNQDGKRPEEVEVTLYANGYKLTAAGTTVKLNADNNWTYTWTDLYKNYRGETIIYTVVEAPVEGYTAGYLATADAETNDIKVTVVNTHEPELTDIPVTKVWNDNDNQDGIRPDSIKVTLYADEKATDKTLTLDAAGNWQGIFSELPTYKDGQEIVYTVKEETVAGYTAEVLTEDGINLKLVNTHEPKEVTVKATKVWADDNDRDGKRPDSIKVHLLKNGEHMGEAYAIELTAETGWACKWENLPKFESGREIVYTVYEELPADAQARALSDYVASYTYNPENWNDITITNTYKPETMEVAVLKVWNDDGNRDGLRPESIEVELYADGKATGKKLTLNETNNWNAQWTGVLKFRDGGTPIVYTVKEVNVPLGYTAAVEQDDVITNGMFIVTNTHEAATTDVIVNKIWADENNNDGKRPDGIIVRLYANGSAVEGARIELNEDNRWSHIWHSVNEQPLYIFDKGEEINYYVDEVGYVIDGEEFEKLPEGYTKTLSTADYTTDITNTRETEKLKLSVKKLWQDSDNNDGIRPEKVTVTLFAGTTEVEKVELSEANQWTYTWTGLYKYLAGEEVAYTIQETAVDGYETSYTTEAAADGTVNWTVTNTHLIETKDVTVSKVWKDNNDAEGYRPDYVNVRLYKNGTAYGDVITLSGSNKWKYTTTLPVYEEGKQIVWTVVETKIPKYYSASYNQQTLTVTNTIQSKDIPKTGDGSNLLFWMGTMLLSCAGAAVLIFDKKRKSKS